MVYFRTRLTTPLKPRSPIVSRIMYAGHEIAEPQARTAIRRRPSELRNGLTANRNGRTDRPLELIKAANGRRGQAELKLSATQTRRAQESSYPTHKGSR